MLIYSRFTDNSYRHLNLALLTTEFKRGIRRPGLDCTPKNDNPLKYARIEEERRYLLERLPDDLPPDNLHLWIIDRYIPGTRLRLRRIESPSGETLALKFGQKYQAPQQPASQKYMTNLYLTETEYQVLSSLGGLTLVKRRYPYLFAGRKYSIDAFEGHLAGLILAEIQSAPGSEIGSITTPAFAAREVTDDPFFNGGSLAALTRDAFQQWLKSL
jgi:CYTH domain-containing protein